MHSSWGTISRAGFPAGSPCPFVLLIFMYFLFLAVSGFSCGTRAPECEGSVAASFVGSVAPWHVGS